MKSLLFTGSSGFLDSNILVSLREKYTVDTLGFSGTNTYNINLARQDPEFNRSYDVILHAAGKAHVMPKSDEDGKEFYKVNYEGTKNLCRGLERVGKPGSFVFISTVAVYGCESGEQITEYHPLNAKTPYGKSKIQAEEYLVEWCERRKIYLTILRPSLLAGKNPPGNLGTMIKGISTGRYLTIDGGKTRKSIAMASDIFRLIPLCEERSGIFNLCDSYHPSFRELELVICRQLNKSLPINVPLWFANGLAKLGDHINLLPISTLRLEKMTQSLTFSNEKLKQELHFTPMDVLSNFYIF